MPFKPVKTAYPIYYHKGKTMNVKELREALVGLPDDTLVILVKDREGNEFSSLDEVARGQYTPFTQWTGTKSEAKFESEWNAIFLLPVN